MSNDTNFADNYDGTDRSTEEVQHLSEVLEDDGKGQAIGRVYSEASRLYRGGRGTAEEVRQSLGDKESFLEGL